MFLEFAIKYLLNGAFLADFRHLISEDSAKGL